MSVAFVNYSTETFSPAGGGSVSTYVWTMCRCAKVDGIEPQVISRAHSRQPYDWPRTIYVEAPSVPAGGLGLLVERAKRKFSRWPHLRHEEYADRVGNAIQEHGLTEAKVIFQTDPEVAIHLRKRFPRMFIAVMFHNYHRMKPGFPGKLGESADVVCAVSQSLANWLEENYELPAGSVKAIHNGIDTETFFPAPAGSNGRVLVNFSGRVADVKGPDLLLEAAIEVARERNDFDVQLLGWDAEQPPATDFERKMRSLAAELEKRGVGVRKAGFVPRERMPAELRKAHIQVLPSRWEEACALSILEAMASGLAMVASTTGGTAELVGDAGLLFAKDNVSELAGHLRTLLADPAKRRDYSQRALARARQWTWEKSWHALAAAIGLNS